MTLEAPDKNSPIPTEGKGVLVLAPPAPRIDLSNYRDIRLEMARVYRLFDQRQMSETDAKARHYMLSTLAGLIKATETEQRLEAIERAMGLRRAEERKVAGHNRGLAPWRK